MDFSETMWAEMKPDVYGGDHCEQHISNWRTHAEGDRGYTDTGFEIGFDARTFPPGSKVVVSEPVCPKCGHTPNRSGRPETFKSDQGSSVTEYTWSCECDFDWRKWVNTQYS